MRDYYSVNEFSKISGVEASTLRYWDRIGLFSPRKRDPENNYRYYSLAQITALNFVTTLSELGIPLKTIAELRKERNPSEFLTLLESKERELDMDLRKLRECSSIIHTRQLMIRHGLKADETEISVVSRQEDWSAILWPRNEYKPGETFIEPLTSLINHATKHRINLGFPIGGRFQNMESFLKNPTQPDHFFSIDPTGTNVLKKGRFLNAYARGYYAELGDLPERMAAYAKENKLKTRGHVYLTYLHDEACLKDHNQYLAHVFVAIQKTKQHR